MPGMTLRKILIHPDPRLKATCTPIATFNKELAQLADDMLETMYHAPGIGLAAPQIGITERMIVMDCVKEENATPEPMVLINPEVVWTSDEKNIYDEGCLSIPDQYAEVERPAAVEVTWQDVDGAKRSEKFDARAGPRSPAGWRHATGVCHGCFVESGDADTDAVCEPRDHGSL